ncbi:MAG TPA: hypothetical protein ENG46_01485 [Acidilobales archaeon]|nr:hypothetical protein [Acidilobales archaeon]
MSYSKIAIILLLITLPVIFTMFCTTVRAVKYQLTYYFEDDFKYANDTEASVNWYIYRSTGDSFNEIVWDPVNTYVHLVKPARYKAAAIYLRNFDMADYIMWKVDFIAYIGGGTGADGLAVAFYHDLGVSSPGWTLGVSGIPGYFIEIDTWKNDWDPLAHHIALMEYSADTAPLHVFAQGLNIRGKWLYVSVTFIREVVTDNIAQGKLTLIVWDNADLVNKEPAGNVIVNETITASFSMDYKYLGFGASTGAATDDHILDWVKVEGYTAVVGGELELGPTTLISLENENNVGDVIAVLLASAITLYLVFTIKSKLQNKNTL